ncbi:WbqC family protein [Polynucleobacter sp. UK-FUSCHL-C3]|uniref:WbqC family protein n=1 Tax=Polynucleobacter sp. UK-FUSCHL-C3 TaxID=2955208 RepID=A0AAU8A2W2_9BURK
MTRIIAIHQPNFFPWLGYFDKIRRADIFIFLDDSQYQKTGGNWSNRVKLLINNEARWLTAPVERSFNGMRNINEMVFSSREEWRSKTLKTLLFAYRGAPFFDETYSIIEPLVKNPQDNVAEYNIYAIKALVSALGYSTNSLICSSDLPTSSFATERLVELIRHVSGTGYLCGGGASNYQEDEIFERVGIKLTYQNFLHPTYSQFGNKEFFAGLSIVDALMNLGFNGVQQLLQNNGE